MSIRLRLTLLYSVILAVTLTGFVLALYGAVSSLSVNAIQNVLTLEIKNNATAIHLLQDPDRPNTVLLVFPPVVQASQDYVQVTTLTGTVLYRSDNLKALGYTLPQRVAARHQLQTGALLQSDVTLHGQRFLINTMLLRARPGELGNSNPQGPPPADRGGVRRTKAGGPQGPPPFPALSPDDSLQLGEGLGIIPPVNLRSTLSAGVPIGILQLATSLRGVDQTLATLREASLIGGIVVIVLACGVGFVLAGTALRPIMRITRVAQEIGEQQDFERRVDYNGPPDEVGHLAATFNSMLDRLRAAYQMQRRFVGDASHELRTPLTTIRGNLGLLERNPPITEADREAVVADLVSETERLMRLVGDLLTLARGDAGNSLRQEPVLLRPLLTTLLGRLAVAYPGRAVGLEGDVDLAALGDPDALLQVVLILLDNALKFTPAHGTVGIVVAVEAGHVVISVQDTGPGISPDAVPYIFDRFYQGDEARTGRGTGLGLTIARALVDQQHGTISVQSQVGQGSVFTVRLQQAVG